MAVNSNDKYAGGFLIGKIFVLKKDRMKWVDSAGVGIVEMLYNLLFHGVIHDAIVLCTFP